MKIPSLLSCYYKGSVSTSYMCIDLFLLIKIATLFSSNNHANYDPARNRNALAPQNLTVVQTFYVGISRCNMHFLENLILVNL